MLLAKVISFYNHWRFHFVHNGAVYQFFDFPELVHMLFLGQKGVRTKMAGETQERALVASYES